MQLIGRQVTGSLSEYTKVPEVSVHKAADTLDDHCVALLEPLGVAVNAVEKADVHGDTVLITGCGPIGLMGILERVPAGIRRGPSRRGRSYFYHS